MLSSSSGLYKSWLIWPAIGMMAGFFLLPALDVVNSSVFDPDFTTEHFERLFSRPVYLAILLRTLGISLVVAVICAVLGYIIAYHIVRQPSNRQLVLLFLVLVPMWMSVLIRSYAWMVMLGREGLVNSSLLALGFIDAPAQLLFTRGAVYVAMVQILLPIQIVTCYSAMREIDLDLVRSARVLGASAWQATRRVFLPLSLDGTMTGMTIVFMLSMGFFITPALIGGRQDMMLANLIEGQVSQLNWSFASALGVLLLSGTILSVVLFRLLANMAAKFLVKGSSG